MRLQSVFRLVALLLAGCSLTPAEAPEGPGPTCVDGRGVDGWRFRDLDGDGYGDPSAPRSAGRFTEGGLVVDCTDCDDNNAAVSPGEPEICDRVDQDCDGLVVEELAVTWYEDQDGDGYGDPDEVVFDCVAYVGQVSEAGDCDDQDRSVHPGATEQCNGVDDDCDGGIDEGLLSDRFEDADWDGYGGERLPGCDVGLDGVSLDGDCDDADPTVHPNAPEITPGVDNDCDGVDDNTLPVAVLRVESPERPEACLPLVLDGGDSSDPDGDDIVAWDWTLLSSPASRAWPEQGLLHGPPDTAALRLDSTGEYVFSLTVDDGADTSPVETLTLWVPRVGAWRPPELELPQELTVRQGVDCIDDGVTVSCPDCEPQPLELAPDRLVDPDGHDLVVRWALLDPTQGRLDSSSGPSTELSFEPLATDPEVGAEATIEVQVVVTDCTGDRVADTLSVDVVCESTVLEEEP